MPMLESTASRKIDYLRLSVTDRCNLRCIYCMPETGIHLKPYSEMLSYEEMFIFAKTAIRAGISRIRLTGGEPLTRRNISFLVHQLSSIPGLTDLSMTTNGILLPFFAKELREAGLKRINISLDSLDPATYSLITRGGVLEDALKAIDCSLKYGFSPVKINVVIMSNVIDEIESFISLVRQKPVHVRFIELMPGLKDYRSCSGEVPMRKEISRSKIEQDFYEKKGSREQLEKRIRSSVDLIPTSDVEGAGPANYFTFKGARGTLGFIAPVSRHFCSSCNRLRLSSAGSLIPCLFSDVEIDAREAIRSGDSEKILSVIKEALSLKPVPDAITARLTRAMFGIGG